MTHKTTMQKSAPRPYFRKHAVPNKVTNQTSLKKMLFRGVSAIAIAALVVLNIHTPYAKSATLSGNIDQCRNGAAGSPVNCTGSAWGNGNLGHSNSHYVEGQSAPYRATVSGLTAGVSTTVRIGYDVRNSGANAIDYLTSYNRINESVDPTSGIGFAVTAGPNFSIPAPTTNLGGQPLASFNALPSAQKQMSIWNGTITNISYVTPAPNLSANQAEQQVDITFTPTGSNILLAWGGHIASRLDWGQNNSAGGINGSPYHMRLKNFTGNQDRSMSADAISGILVVKKVVGGNAQPSDFTINVTGTSPTPNSFPGDSNGTSVSIASGSYSVTEQVVSEYTPNYSTDCSGTIGTGETKVCTITNTFNAPTTGNITVTKVVVNNNGGTKVVSDFVLSVGNTTVTSGATNAFGARTYTVSETGPAGYAGTFSGDCDVQTHQITVVAGNDYNCTITNDDIQPLLTVTKVVVNNDGGQLQVADFPLFVGNVSVTSGAQNGFNASTTAYVVSETGDPGYAGTISGDCDLQGNIILSVGDVKSCTITNNDIPAIPQTGTITVTKVVDNTGGGTKQVADFPLFVNTTAVTSGTTTTFNTGSYVVSETGDANYTAAFSGDCDAKTGAITLAANQDLTCTITNTFIIPPPTDFDVSVVKTVNDNTPSVGDTITYTLVAANAGPADSTGNVLTDVIPTGLTYVSDDGGVDTAYDSGTHTLTWTIGTLTSGQSVTLHVDATVDSGQEGQTITNTGSIPFDEELDTNPDNNSDSIDLTVNRPSGGCTSNCGGGGGGGGGTPATGSISGVTYIDNNSDGTFDSGDTALPGVTVYIDSNNNGQLDSGETNTQSDSSGAFHFNNVSPGTYTVREVIPSGYTVTEPTPSVQYTVVSNNNSVSDRNFGHIAGRVLGDVTTTPSTPRVLGTELPRTGNSIAWLIMLGSIAAYAAVSATRKPEISKK